MYNELGESTKITHTISIKTKEVKVVYEIVDNDKLKRRF
jgi:hypothetical protein